jgi:hypothetical protein
MLMSPPTPSCNDAPSPADLFYRDALQRLEQAQVPFLVGGAYALRHYAGIVRHTKDLDLFTRQADVPRLLSVLAQAGYHTKTTFDHWLAKVFSGEFFIDVIFSSGNGLCPVDDSWFAFAPGAHMLDRELRLIPVEEMIWQKAFIMERERFDGADVNHLLRAQGAGLDWQRLLARFGPHWRVLLGHLVLFGFVYPAQQGVIPAWLLAELIDRLRAEKPLANEPAVCWGLVLSREQYLVDTEHWGYRDPRLLPSGRMTAEQVTQWTAAIDH